MGNAAIYGGWLLFAYAGMQFVFAPLIGNLSDRFGRRPILLTSVITFALDNLICALAPNFAILLIGQILSGISGGSYSTASAYIADVSTDENRAKNFGLLGIAFGIGFILGPIIGGFLGEFRAPNTVLRGGADLVPEFCRRLFPSTRNARRKRSPEIRMEAVQSAWRPETDAQSHRHSVARARILHADARTHVVSGGMGLCRQLRYGWSESDIGISLGIYGLCAAIVMGLVLPRIVSRFGEWRTAVIGLAFAALGFFGYASAPRQGWLVYVVIVATYLKASLTRPLAAGLPQSTGNKRELGAMAGRGGRADYRASDSRRYYSRSSPRRAHPSTLAARPTYFGGIFVLIALIVFVLRVEKPSLAKDEVLVPGALAKRGRISSFIVRGPTGLDDRLDVVRSGPVEV